LNPYLLAVLTAAAGVALTRITWPFFSPTPFAPVFAAVAISTHWGHWRAGVVAMNMAAVGAVLLFPTTGPQGWRPVTLVAFMVVSAVGCALIAGRNRATAALRASESELRKTIEELRASEEAVRQAHKLEAIGHLAAGVAHNFNNVLTATIGYAEVLEDPSSSSETRRDAMAEIRKATERGAFLSRQLLTFGRRHSARATRVLIDQTVLGLRDKFARVSREDIELQISARTEGASVLIDPRDLEQMLFNLVLNARDALPAGGRIRIEAAMETIDDPTNNPAVVPGSYVCLRVCDNGTGMSADAQAHLFEPFFTTKDVGEGTGLGLPFVHGVAEHGGGFVVVETAAGRGTTVSVYLPPIREAVSAPG
jgi:signal transduction histidine kinase